MKEFDLEKAKVGHPVCTRDGKEARILCFDRIGHYPIVALVKEAGDETIFSYNKKGRFSNDGRGCMCDLFMKSAKQKRWINLLKISKDPKAKEYLKRFFGIEEKPKYEFKPFDKVLVRDEDDKEWHISLFAREIVDDSDGLSYKYECSNGTLWDCCIPFEGNECLLETAENPEK